MLREIEVRVERPMRGDTGVFQLPDPAERDDVALVVHTSGTTGAPEAGRDHLRQHPRERARARAGAWGSATTSAGCARCRSSHVGGLMVVLRSALMATTAVLAPPPFDAEAVARTLRDGGITIASLVPDAAAAAARRGRDARARRCAACCSAAARCRPRCSSAPAPPASRSARATGSRRRARRSPSPSRATSRRPGAPLPGVGVAIAARRRDPRLRRDGQHAGQPAHRRPRPARRAGPPRSSPAARAT